MSLIAYPAPSSTAVSVRMRRNRSGDTKFELRVRSALHRAGLRFRKGLLVRAGDVSVRPDVVFTRARIAVFLDGCFWHSCPDHGTKPRQNSAYWTDKLARNAARDRRVGAALERAGWTVLRFWEHEAPEDVVTFVAAALRRRSSDACGSRLRWTRSTD
jgi:DNA mismatch endonuclease (patch repair protein)